MLFMVICAVVLGWIGKKLHETNRRQAVVATIESLDGWVVYHGDESETSSWRTTRHFRRVQRVHLERSQVNDTDLVHLKELTRLEYLDLSDTEVTDVGLMHLEGLTSLKWLNLRNTEITDAGLIHLEWLENLGRLLLNGTRVTDAGVRNLHPALPDCSIYH